MTVVTIAVVGITAVLLAVALKGMKGEYGTYLVMAAGFFIFFYGVGKLTTILDTIKQVQSYIRINSVYLSTLIKMIGITYVAEFAAGICKDAGYGAVGTQIEIFGKLSVLAVSMPILLALIETCRYFCHEGASVQNSRITGAGGGPVGNGRPVFCRRAVHGHDQLCGGARWRVSCRFRGDGGRSGDERGLHGFGTV